MPIWGWRGVFFVGVLPALFTLWIRRKVEEPEMWRRTSGESRGRIGELFTPGRASTTVFIILMNACCLFGWWGLNLWVPAYLNLPPERGGIGLSSSAMSWFVIAMQVGMWLGYVSFGYIADAIGRKRAYVLLTNTEYERLTRPPRSIVEALAMPGVEDIDLDSFLPRRHDLPRAAEFD